MVICITVPRDSMATMTTRARILLIDDDIFVRDAVALGLGDAGYEVVTAPGAAARTLPMPWSRWVFPTPTGPKTTSGL